METPKYIKNWELVVDHFGYWPTFHDDDILKIKHDFKQKMTKVEIKSIQWVDKPCITTFVLKNVKKDPNYDYKYCPTIAELEFKKQEECILMDIAPCWVDKNYKGSEWLSEEVTVESVRLV